MPNHNAMPPIEPTSSRKGLMNAFVIKQPKELLEQLISITKKKKRVGVRRRMPIAVRQIPPMRDPIPLALFSFVRRT